MQNPVIGGLYNQLKIRTADQLKLLKTAPKIKDLKIQNALDRLKKFNLNRGAVDDDDDNDIPGLPPSRRGEPSRPNFEQDDQEDDDDAEDDYRQVHAHTYFRRPVAPHKVITSLHQRPVKQALHHTNI